MLKAGIIGLPNVGKSTLFNSLTNSNVLSANYMFTTLESNIGVVNIIDERLDIVAKITEAKKVIPTSIEFVDIPGLVKGASLGEGLGNQFLDNIRNVDCLVHVVRCFKDENIVHLFEEINPVNDLTTVELELIYADLAVIERRIDRLHKKVIVDKLASEILEYNTLLKIQEGLLKDTPIRNLGLSFEEKRSVRGYNFLTIKSVLYVANFKDDDLLDLDSNQYYKVIKDHADKQQVKLVSLSIKLCEDLNDLSLEERNLFYDEMGISDSDLKTLINATYDTFGLKTFFSFLSGETRAWTYKDGMTAKECAGVIHTDFERGFIRAEAVSFKDLKECGNYQKCKEAGKVRLEGRDYLVKDGDILTFRFNVWEIKKQCYKDKRKY